ncbi:hypothetical protein ACF0H5_006201 [Mactra antiquata]
MEFHFVWKWVILLMLFGLDNADECSREYSRVVRDFFKYQLKPVYTNHDTEVPKTCPFNVDRDLFHQHEEHKTEEGYGKWACDYCGKKFYAEMFLDKHLHNRHSNHLYMGPDSVCLADYCDIFRCDIISGRIDPSFWDTALCIEDDMTDYITKCNNAFKHCLPTNVPSNISSHILKKVKSLVCSSLTCNKYWYVRKIEPSQWRMLFKTFLTVSLIGGMIVYYFIAYHHFYSGSLYDDSNIQTYTPYIRDEYHHAARRKRARYTKPMKGWT